MGNCATLTDPLWRSSVTREVVQPRNGPGEPEKEAHDELLISVRPRGCCNRREQPRRRHVPGSSVSLLSISLSLGPIVVVCPWTGITTTPRIDRYGCPLLVSQWHRNNRYFLRGGHGASVGVRTKVQ